MTLFLFFYVIYGAAHLYAFLKIKSTFALKTQTSVILGFILFFMTLSPSLIHLYSFKGPDGSVRLVAYAGFIWMAVLFLFISSSIPIDIYNLLVRLTGKVFRKETGGGGVPLLPSFFIPVFLSAIITTYGYFEATGLKTEKLIIETSKLPKTVNKLTIVQISDLHLGVIVNEEKLNKVLREINSVKPDLIVSTGDLLDGSARFVDHLAEKLKMTHANLGKFAVTGNHEFYADINHSLEFLKDAGFTVLRGEGANIQNLINIAGVDDPTGIRMNQNPNNLPERDILSKLPHDIFTLLLKHRPETDKNSLGLFDLQLSGHSHKGQIFPFSLVTKLYYKTHAGYYRGSDTSAIYVSRGAGTAGPPVRFLSPPEITIIEIVRKPLYEPSAIDSPG